MMEGSGSGSVLLTNGSGTGRAKNLRILRIRIRNTGIFIQSFCCYCEMFRENMVFHENTKRANFPNFSECKYKIQIAGWEYWDVMWCYSPYTFQKTVKLFLYWKESSIFSKSCFINVVHSWQIEKYMAFASKYFTRQHNVTWIVSERMQYLMVQYYCSQLPYLYEGGSEVVVEVLVNLLLVDVGQQACDRLEHEDQHQQDRVLKIRNIHYTLQQLIRRKGAVRRCSLGTRRSESDTYFPLKIR